MRSLLDPLLLNPLTSPSALKRELAAVGLGLVLLFGSWGLSYLFLPEGLLRGRTAASVVSRSMSDRSVAMLTLQILAWNGLVAFLLVPLAARIAVGRFSLGYLVGFGNAVLFGLYLGTNSMQNQAPQPRPPSLSIFRGTGVWEITAYLTVGAALACVYRVRQRSLFTFGGERVESPGSLGLAEWSLLALAAGLLLLTAWMEASRVVSRS